MSFRYKIIAEYDGTPFFGWQRQEGVPTVQQCLEEAVLPLSKCPITMFGSGRTDTGVHALGQVAHFNLDRDIDPFRVQECMNAYLRENPIVVLSAERVPSTFDARFSTVERSYLYKILNRRAAPAIMKNRCWHIMAPLDEEGMNTAAQYLVGTHDFSSFRAAGCQATSPIKTLNYIKVWRENELILIECRAKSFLYHQVRNIVGSLFMVGAKRWTLQKFLDVFAAKNRAIAGQTAPAAGLYFWRVTY